MNKNKENVFNMRSGAWAADLTRVITSLPMMWPLEAALCRW